MGGKDSRYWQQPIYCIHYLERKGHIYWMMAIFSMPSEKESTTINYGVKKFTLPGGWDERSTYQ